MNGSTLQRVSPFALPAAQARAQAQVQAQAQAQCEPSADGCASSAAAQRIAGAPTVVDIRKLRPGCDDTAAVAAGSGDDSGCSSGSFHDVVDAALDAPLIGGGDGDAQSLRAALMAALRRVEGLRCENERLRAQLSEAEGQLAARQLSLESWRRAAADLSEERDLYRTQLSQLCTSVSQSTGRVELVELEGAEDSNPSGAEQRQQGSRPAAAQLTPAAPQGAAARAAAAAATALAAAAASSPLLQRLLPQQLTRLLEGSSIGGGVGDGDAHGDADGDADGDCPVRPVPKHAISAPCGSLVSATMLEGIDGGGGDKHAADSDQTAVSLSALLHQFSFAVPVRAAAEQPKRSVDATGGGAAAAAPAEVIPQREADYESPGESLLPLRGDAAGAGAQCAASVLSLLSPSPSIGRRLSTHSLLGSEPAIGAAEQASPPPPEPAWRRSTAAGSGGCAADAGQESEVDGHGTESVRWEQPPSPQEQEQRQEQREEGEEARHVEEQALLPENSGGHFLRGWLSQRDLSWLASLGPSPGSGGLWERGERMRRFATGGLERADSELVQYMSHFRDGF